MADSTLAALGAAAALDGTELVYTVQGGADKKATVAQIKTYANTVGSNTQVTYINGGVLAGNAGLTFNVGAHRLMVGDSSQSAELWIQPSTTGVQSFINFGTSFLSGGIQIGQAMQIVYSDGVDFNRGLTGVSGEARIRVSNGSTGYGSILSIEKFTTKTADHTLVIGDMSTTIEMNVGSANNLTVPPNSSVAFPLGTIIAIEQIGAGQTLIVAGSGVTINSKSGHLKITGQYSGAVLRKRATDTWTLIGDLTA